MKVAYNFKYTQLKKGIFFLSGPILLPKIPLVGASVPVCTTIFLSVCLCAYQSVCLSVSPCVSLFVCQCVSLNDCLCVWLVSYAYLPTCLSACLLLSDLTGCPVDFLQVLSCKEQMTFTKHHTTKLIWPQVWHSEAPFQAFGPLSSTPMQCHWRVIFIAVRGKGSKAWCDDMR